MDKETIREKLRLIESRLNEYEAKGVMELSVAEVESYCRLLDAKLTLGRELKALLPQED